MRECISGETRPYCFGWVSQSAEGLKRRCHIVNEPRGPWHKASGNQFTKCEKYVILVYVCELMKEKWCKNAHPPVV